MLLSKTVGVGSFGERLFGRASEHSLEALATLTFVHSFGLRIPPDMVAKLKSKLHNGVRLMLAQQEDGQLVLWEFRGVLLISSRLTRSD